MTFDEDSGYGIYRAEANATTGAGWRVFFMRQGMRISRAFQDSVYGSPEDGLSHAIKYRNAVFASIPPRTNTEQSVMLRKDNQSGISGVRHTDYDGREYWMAKIGFGAEQKGRYFSVRKYGFERAKELAISQRDEWLSDKELKNYTRKEDVGFADYGALHSPYQMTQEDARRIIAEINDRFDQLRPFQLIVRVRQYRDGTLSGYVSNGGRPAVKKQLYVGTKKLTNVEALTKMATLVAAAIDDIYHPQVSEWYFCEYGSCFRSPLQFDITTGFKETLFIPLEITSTSRSPTQ